MSTRTRSLRKRLKEKEESKKGNEGGKEGGIVKNPMPKRSVALRAPRKRRDSYIDPLEYFQKEHLIVKEDKMDEYIFNGDKDANKEDGGKKGLSKSSMVMPMPGGPMGMGMGFKLNFEEMMKARAKVKKEPLKEETKFQRPASVAMRKKPKKKEESSSSSSSSSSSDSEENEKKKGENDEQTLYLKLVMARNRYNQLSSVKENTYDKIMKQINALRAIVDLPKNYLEKVDEFESKLKIPHRLILDPDVQEIENENEKVNENPFNLDDIIDSLGLTGTN